VVVLSTLGCWCAIMAGCTVGGAIPADFFDALGAEQPATKPVATAAIVQPAGATRSIFHIYEDQNAASANQSLRSTSRHGEPGAGPTLRITRTNLDGAILRDETYAQTDAGLALARSVSVDRSVITEYDPPMLQFPTSLAPGERAATRMQLVIRSIDHPERVQHRGAAVNTVELVGLQQVHTGVGVFEATHIRATFSGTFGMARVARVTDMWIAPHRGVVAQRVHERVTVLGAPISGVDQALLLLSQGDGDPTASTMRETSSSDNSQ